MLLKVWGGGLGFFIEKRWARSGLTDTSVSANAMATKRKTLATKSKAERQAAVFPGARLVEMAEAFFCLEPNV